MSIQERSEVIDRCVAQQCAVLRASQQPATPAVKLAELRRIIAQTPAARQ